MIIGRISHIMAQVVDWLCVNVMQFIGVVSSFIWDHCLIYVLICTSLFFTFSLKFIQARHFVKALKLIKGDGGGDSMGITSFQALCTSLASRIGTGNIVGVGIAIYLGGPGAIFWMWLLAFLGMATSFAEGCWHSCTKCPIIHPVCTEVDRHTIFAQALKARCGLRYLQYLLYLHI